MKLYRITGFTIASNFTQEFNYSIDFGVTKSHLINYDDGIDYIINGVSIFCLDFYFDRPFFKLILLNFRRCISYFYLVQYMLDI